MADFWLNQFGSLIVTLLGTGAGAFLALMIDRRLRREQQERDARQNELLEAQTRRQVLFALKEAVEKNLRLVEQMEKELRPESVIFYNVDLTLIDALSPTTFQTLADIDLLKTAQSFRYELQHLHGKVALQLDMTYGIARTAPDFVTFRSGLVGAIIDHIPRIKHEGQLAIQMIEDYDARRQMLDGQWSNQGS